MTGKDYIENKTMPNDNYEEKYTKPDLRRKIKEELKESDKGGKPGQWSARKSQLLVQEYEKRGGDYKKNQKDEAAKSLEEWGEQNWQTASGEARARKDGKTKRYLPEEVWDKLSEEQKKKAEQIKEEASQKGQQFVEWTPAIKEAMQEAGYLEEDTEPTKQELYKQAQELDISDRSKMNKQELQEAVEDAQNEPTKQELYEQAQELDISDRSKMNKQELQEAVEDARN